MASEAYRCLSNNLNWYRSVFATHGLAGTKADGLWSCPDAVPPYYSNAITLRPHGHDAQRRAILDLADALGRPFSIKDAFATLDLTQIRFRFLFAAEWIWRDPIGADDDTEWERVTTADALAEWEAVWGESSPADTRVFLPPLLADQSIALFALRRDGRIVAGCAGNRSEDAVGLSNVFTTGPDPAANFAAATAAVSGWAPGLPIVGYESGESLAIAIELGFRPVGPLRIWQGGE